MVFWLRFGFGVVVVAFLELRRIGGPAVVLRSALMDDLGGLSLSLDEGKERGKVVGILKLRGEV